MRPIPSRTKPIANSRACLDRKGSMRASQTPGTAGAGGVPGAWTERAKPHYMTGRTRRSSTGPTNAITPLMMYTQSYSVMFAGRIFGDSGAEYNDRGSIALRAGWQYRGTSRGNPVAGLPGADA